jgi:curli production assembly/transport component CsgE
MVAHHAFAWGLALSLISHAFAQSAPEAVKSEVSVASEGSEARSDGHDGVAIQRPRARLSDGLNGVMIDRTMTMIGKTFYRQFSQQRLDSPALRNTSLSIHERPSARWGSLIWITEGNNVLYEATLPPRLNDVDMYASAAVSSVSDQFLRRKVLEALRDDPDMADDEF